MSGSSCAPLGTLNEQVGDSRLNQNQRAKPRKRDDQFLLKGGDHALDYQAICITQVATLSWVFVD